MNLLIIDGHAVKRLNYAAVGHDKKDNPRHRGRDYSQEYKKEVLALAGRIGVSGAAKELGIYESQLYGWRSKARLAHSSDPR